MTLTRSGIKPGKGIQRKTPMPRTGFKTPSSSSGLLRVAAVQRESKTKSKGLKSSRPKMTPIRKAARGQDCTLQFSGVCNRDPETTVLCHSNYMEDGKCMGKKAPDEKACFGCSSCHDLLDGRRPRPAGLTAENVKTTFYTAVERTHEFLRPLGLISGTSSGATGLAPKQLPLEQ